MQMERRKLIDQAAERSPARARLADAIAGVRQAEAEISENEKRIQALFEQLVNANGAIAAAAAALEKAQQERSSSVDPLEAVRAVKTASRKFEEAEEALETIVSATHVAEDRRRSLDDALQYKRLALHEATTGVLRDDPAVKRLCTRYEHHLRETVNMRRALEFIGSAIPPECKSMLFEHAWPELPGARPWKEAIAALENNADAKLPENCM